MLFPTPSSNLINVTADSCKYQELKVTASYYKTYFSSGFQFLSIRFLSNFCFIFQQSKALYCVPLVRHGWAQRGNWNNHRLVQKRPQYSSFSAATWCEFLSASKATMGNITSLTQRVRLRGNRHNSREEENSPSTAWAGAEELQALGDHSGCTWLEWTQTLPKQVLWQGEVSFAKRLLFWYKTTSRGNICWYHQEP